MRVRKTERTLDISTHHHHVVPKTSKWNFFFFFGENKHMVISIFLPSLWSAYFLSTGNVNVLLISFYSPIIRKQIKKRDWTCSQDTIGLNSSSCLIFTGQVGLNYVPASVVSLTWRQTINKNRQWCLLARTSSQLTFDSILKSFIFIFSRARILIRQLLWRNGL